MSDLSQLTPPSLWKIFAQICAIPHPSYHEEQLAQHIVQWANEQKLITVERDAVGNILLRKPATADMPGRPSVVLQAHLDMVPQKNNDTQHDFTRDPIKPYLDGEWVRAEGTTLGADNGIGLASALAVLVDNTVSHGPLEVLLTITEEAGMHGALGLQPGWLQSRILINTDSEQEGEIYMGCAGGVDAITRLPLSRETCPEGYRIYQLTLKGLRGGHSGCDIHLGLGNANKLLVNWLFSQASDLGLRLIDFQGGTLRNAIPREARATFALPESKLVALQDSVKLYEADLQRDLSRVEPNLVLQLFPLTVLAADVLTLACQQRLLALLNATPNGVFRMSDEIPGIVETSLNLGVINLENNQAQAIAMIRSSLETGKQNLIGVLRSLGQLAGANVQTSVDYPGWNPNVDSPIMQLVVDTYRHLFDIEPEIKVIHAGLECGLFKRPYPDMDMVSIGPTIKGAHSPDERVNIISVNKYWQLLTAVLKAIPSEK